jgi:hypothetical protein
VTVAEVWNGTSWTLHSTPHPTGATESDLDAVSCSSATACTAVGYFVNGSSTRETLAEEWNGTSWTVQTTPNPKGATNTYLGAVSCSSATACTAVGNYENSSNTFETLAEVWNGTSWTVQTTPNPKGATDSALGSVSCSSATACMAVGQFDDSAGARMMLAEGWNGTSWTVQTTPNPKGATNSSLDALSCSSATGCTAVGYYENSSNTYETLAEVWDGTSWTVQSTPNPNGATNSYLGAVSCSSATACTAVGYYQNSSFTDEPFAEDWNGTSWTEIPQEKWTPNMSSR